MFGYIKPSRQQLRVGEYEVYRGIYCGLCKQLGKSFGCMSRFTLSYDFAFLSCLYLALGEAEPSFEPKRCFVHPLRRQCTCQNSEELTFPAGVAMIMLYHKLRDNYQDGGFKDKMVSFFGMLFAKGAFKKAVKEYPKIGDAVEEMMVSQRQLEQEQCSSIDKACEPTAHAMETIAASLSEDAVTIRVLERFGYLLGRWVYMIDALDDIEDDIKNKNYNPFVLSYGLKEDSCEETIAEIRSKAKGSLYMTIGELAKTFELLSLRRYEGILENIIYLGLRESVDSIPKPKTKEKNK